MPISPNTGAVVPVTVTTAVEMDDDLRAKALAKAKELFGSEVELVERVEPKIIGGIIIESAQERFDASVRTQLAAVRSSLSSSFMGGVQ